MLFLNYLEVLSSRCIQYCPWVDFYGESNQEAWWSYLALDPRWTSKWCATGDSCQNLGPVVRLRTPFPKLGFMHVQWMKVHLRKANVENKGKTWKYTQIQRRFYREQMIGRCFKPVAAIGYLSRVFICSYCATVHTHMSRDLLKICLSYMYFFDLWSGSVKNRIVGYHSAGEWASKWTSFRCIQLLSWWSKLEVLFPKSVYCTVLTMLT